MFPTASGGVSFTSNVANEAATLRFMADVAAILVPGDIVTLSGDLGAGKTTFARALIRHLANDQNIAVPSPTFTLMQTYDLPRFPVVHADLYRLNSASELMELGFDDLPDDTVMLIEWPDRAAGALPPDRFDIAFMLEPKLGREHRAVRVTGYGACAPRASRIATIRAFIDRSNFAGANRQPLAGDASTRRYERLRLSGRSALLMDSPRRPDGPPIRDGKSYSAIAHLAEDVRPFVAMADALRAQGLSAPEIYEADLHNGLLLIEDFGSDGVTMGDPPQPIIECYTAATDLLIGLHAGPLPRKLPMAKTEDYLLPPYDEDAFLIEVALLPDWYLAGRNARIGTDARDEFIGLWRNVLQPVLAAPPTWVLRDFHSPNLMWLPQRRDAARLGLLDFQDALWGPAAYDLASLLQDARIDVPESLEMNLLGRYTITRRDIDPRFDRNEFLALYAALAAQRASKILGIFTRLNIRDGKPQYLRHIPRIWNYLQRSLEHPSLAPLASWYAAHVSPPGDPA